MPLLNSDCIPFLNGECTKNPCDRRHNLVLRSLIDQGCVSPIQLPPCREWADTFRSRGRPYCSKGADCPWCHPEELSLDITELSPEPVQYYVYWDTENIRLPPIGSATPAEVVTSLKTFLQITNATTAPIHVTAYHRNNLQVEHVKNSLRTSGVTLIHTGIKENSVDTQMISKTLIHAMTLLATPGIQRNNIWFVIMSGDRDFADCVNAIRDTAGMNVIIVYNSQANTDYLAQGTHSISWESILEYANILHSIAQTRSPLRGLPRSSIPVTPPRAGISSCGPPPLSQPQSAASSSSEMTTSPHDAAPVARWWNPARYKSQICKWYEQDGFCKYEDKCIFAHGHDELRVAKIPPIVDISEYLSSV